MIVFWIPLYGCREACKECYYLGLTPCVTAAVQDRGAFWQPANSNIGNTRGFTCMVESDNAHMTSNQI